MLQHEWQQSGQQLCWLPSGIQFDNQQIQTTWWFGEWHMLRCGRSSKNNNGFITKFHRFLFTIFLHSRQFNQTKNIWYGEKHCPQPVAPSSVKWTYVLIIVLMSLLTLGGSIAGGYYLFAKYRQRGNYSEQIDSDRDGTATPPIYSWEIEQKLIQIMRCACVRQRHLGVAHQNFMYNIYVFWTQHSRYVYMFERDFLVCHACAYMCIVHAWICTSLVFSMFTLRKERDKYMVFFYIFSALQSIWHITLGYLSFGANVWLCAYACMCLRVCWHGKFLSDFCLSCSGMPALALALSLVFFLSCILCKIFIYIIPIHKNFYLDTVTNLH